MKSAQLIVSNVHFGYLKRVILISEFNFGVRIFVLHQYVRLQIRFADSIVKLYFYCFMSNFVFKMFFDFSAGCCNLSL